MTLKWKLMASLVILLSGCMQVFAADGLTADCNAPKVSVSIAPETLTAGEAASCVILPANIAYAALDRGLLLTHAVFAGQFTAGADGSAAWNISLPADTPPAQYKVYVKTEAKLLSEPFYFMNNDGKQQIVKEFNQTDAQGISVLLRKYSMDTPVLTIDTEGLYREIESEINTALLSYRDASGGFGSLENIERVFHQSLALHVINHATDADLIQAVEQHATVLELIVDEIYERNQEEIAKILISYRAAQSGKMFSTVEAVCSAYLKSYVTAQINAIEAVSEMDAWVVKYADILGIDAKKYANYKAPSVGTVLISQRFADAEHVKQKIEQRMAQLDRTDDGGSGGSSSISSGSRRPSGSGTPGPIYTPSSDSGSDNLPTNNGQFADIGEVPWAAGAIDYLHKAGFVNGKGDNRFAPNDAVTRAEFAAILARSFSLITAEAKSGFADVTTSDWYAQAVFSLADAGIINGRGDGTFGAHDVVTRQDMAVMLDRVMAYKAIVPAAVRECHAFDDQPMIAAYAQQAIEHLYVANVINGMGDGTFAPNNGCTRAQVAKAVYDVIMISE